MERDKATTDRLQKLIVHISGLTQSGELHWERQQGSAHRYARWNNNLLILGPADVDDQRVPRYLFITPFDSPDCIEVNSEDPVLASAVLALFDKVDAATRSQLAVDPFSVDTAVLDRLIS